MSIDANLKKERSNCAVDLLRHSVELTVLLAIVDERNTGLHRLFGCGEEQR